MVEWAGQLQTFFARHGHKVPIRRGNGIKRGGRGVSGVWHLEPFFAADAKARRIIESNPAEYAAILSRTIGQLPGSTLIAPHTQQAQGAISDGISERDFYINMIYPHLEQ